MRKCDNCKYRFGEWCIHPTVKKMEDEDCEAVLKYGTTRSFWGDLWQYIGDTPKWCPLLKELTQRE